MKKKASLIGTIIGVIMFVIVIAGITYAYYTWQSTDINTSGTSEYFKINYVNGKNITGTDLVPIGEGDFIDGNTIKVVEGMALTTVSIGIDSSCNVSGDGTITLTPTTISSAFTTGSSVGSIKYKVVQYSSSTYPDVTVNNLKDQAFTILNEGSITSSESIDLYSMSLISGVTNEYLIIFYLDEVLVSNDAGTATFHGTIYAKAVQSNI